MFSTAGHDHYFVSTESFSLFVSGTHQSIHLFLLHFYLALYLSIIIYVLRVDFLCSGYWISSSFTALTSIFWLMGLHCSYKSIINYQPVSSTQTHRKKLFILLVNSLHAFTNWTFFVLFLVGGTATKTLPEPATFNVTYFIHIGLYKLNSLSTQVYQNYSIASWLILLSSILYLTPSYFSCIIS